MTTYITRFKNEMCISVYNIPCVYVCIEPCIDVLRGKKTLEVTEKKESKFGISNYG